jgi:glycosyltransferase involved in cell wall biosynthesis
VAKFKRRGEARVTTLNQFIVGATLGDAITDEALLLQRWVRGLGYASEIFALYIDPAIQHLIRPFTTWQPRADETRAIYHHSIGSPVAERLIAASLDLILIYHNVTPPEFFETTDPALSREMIEGRAQLRALRAQTILALADSPFNEQDLIAEKFRATGILPIALDEARVNLPVNPALIARERDAGPSLLFVGRQVPNKKQEDLVKLLYFFRRIEPRARLYLVGDAWMPAYAHWLKDFARDLACDDAIFFAGKTAQPDLVTYYRIASVYVSMSEHEGFGKPLIESMYLGLPVLAYAAASVPGTLGDAGILFQRKDFEALAEIVNVLVCDQALRARIIARQRARVQEFLEPQVRAKWQTFLRDLDA